VIAGWAVVSIASLEDLAQNGVGFPGRATPWALLLVAATWCTLTVRATRPGTVTIRGPSSAVA